MTKKRCIAFDLDDVIFGTAYPILQYYSRKFGITVKPENFYCSEPSVWGASSGEVVSDRIQGFLETTEHQELTPTPEAIRALHQISQRFDLYVVTGRSECYAQITERAIQKHLPGIFKSVVFTNYNKTTAQPKAQVCQEIGADTLVDDHLYHATAAANSGINVLLFGDYPWNQANNLPPNITRVAGWYDLTKLLLYDE